MTDVQSRAVYLIRFRPEPGVGEEQAVRALRAILKAALRLHGMRCVSAEPETTARDEGEVPR